MADTEFPDDLIDLQRQAHAAWDAVEEHRKTVDARRRAAATPPSETEPWRTAVLPPWTDEDDAKHEALLAAARQAQEAVAAGIAEAGLAPAYDVVQGLHKAARQA